MTTLAALRQRSGQLFTELLEAQTRRPRARRRLGAVAAPPTFSWFDPRDASRAAGLAFRLSAFAASRADRNAALGAALDHAESERARAHPELVRQGLALFVTHNMDGRRLLKPRTVVAAPALFRPPRARGAQLRLSIGGASPGLDYWREDALANEHHQHWHEVYPYAGLPPADFRTWVTDTPRADLVAILTALDPTQDWAAQLAQATVNQIARFFANLAGQGELQDLPDRLYRKLFRLNDRQGELFFYMHEQMLARYDAELLANGLARVDPFSPSKWPQPIDEGYDPTGLAGFFRRDQDRTLGPNARTELRALEQEIKDAIDQGKLDASGGMVVPIDRTNLGEAAESTVRQLRVSNPAKYGGLHNTGHVRIASLSAGGNGVMIATTTAIRDQVFWRWHKHVDDLNAAWQDKQPAISFADAPGVVIRDGLGANPAQPWTSPDIILVETVELPKNRTPKQLETLGTQLFGGAAWDQAFVATTASANGVSVTTTDRLTTSMRTASFGGKIVSFLAHEPFSYFLRLENPSGATAHITVRIFLAPETTAADRRAWIEMDKFMVDIPANTRRVVYRPDTESSVIKRPAESSPAAVTTGTPTSSEGSYCDCGWPYTLLLPRGTQAGMRYRLLVICTDGAIDQVGMPDHCGSMSYCGSVDRYPDARDMGYPFARPFPGAAATAIRDATLAVPTMAGRSVTIRTT